MKVSTDYTLTSKEVHALALRVMLQFPFVSEENQEKARDLGNALLYAASFRLSLNQACSMLEGMPHPSGVRKHLSTACDDLEALEGQVNRMLASFLPSSLGKHPPTVAIDLVDLPYHGTVDDEHQGQVRRSKAKSGTTHFFTYATAYLIHHGHRYTLALYRVRQGQTMDQVLERMILRFRELRIHVVWYLLDRGFYSVKVIQMLRHLRFIIPAIKTGKKATEHSEATGTQAFAALKSSRWERYTMRNPQGESVTFELAVVCRNFQGKWGRHERETLLYATNSRWKKKPDWVCERYRQRFGIESSYRQLNQARIKTSTRNPGPRLLFVAVALLLRQVWVWLHRAVIATRGGGHRGYRPHLLPLQTMLCWLAFEVTQLHSLRTSIPLSHDFWDAFYELFPLPSS